MVSWQKKSTDYFNFTEDFQGKHVRHINNSLLCILGSILKRPYYFKNNWFLSFPNNLPKIQVNRFRSLLLFVAQNRLPHSKAGAIHIPFLIACHSVPWFQIQNILIQSDFCRLPICCQELEKLKIATKFSHLKAAQSISGKHTGFK